MQMLMLQHAKIAWHMVHVQKAPAVAAAAGAVHEVRGVARELVGVGF